MVGTKEMQLSSRAKKSVPESRMPAENFGRIEELTKGQAGILFHSKVFDIVRVPFENAEGKIDIFDIVDQLHGTRVLIVVRDQRGQKRIAFPEQDRQKDINSETGTWGRRSVELPGGAVERQTSGGTIKEENILANVFREILQEVGVRAVSARPLYRERESGVSMDPGLGPGKVYYFVVEGGTVEIDENNEAVALKNKPERTEGKITVKFYTLPDAYVQARRSLNALSMPPALDYILGEALEDSALRDRLRAIRR